MPETPEISVQRGMLAELLLNWFSDHARDLPWRGQSDPYAIWVSEVMLQQTRVETVIPYYQRWMARFPDIPTLANATLQDVLSVWEGLGYYSRARNLHRAAGILLQQGGQLPADVGALQRLPGVGRYIASAIASIAFGMDQAALDGNVRRVMARLFNVTEPARSPQGEQRLWELATEHLPPRKDRLAGAYNQALMDLGATICTPRNPACGSCPLEKICLARELGVQEQRPVALPRRKIPHHIVTAAVIVRLGQVLITQRPQGGLLGGLWEFPGGKLQAGEGLQVGLRREIAEELGVEVRVGASLGVYRHAYTHFRVTLHAFRCELLNGKEPQPRQVEDLRWVTPGELAAYPMGKIDRQIAVYLCEQEVV